MNNRAMGNDDNAALIAAYLRAKDGSRPHLMRRAFAGDAELEMVVNTEAIAFPPTARSVEAIAETLVHRFTAAWENVYTFCLGRPRTGDRTPDFACRWLVGMTGRQDGDVRLGCGRYDWRFTVSTPRRVGRLGIRIDAMAILPGQEADTVLDWLSGLPYPWCGARTILRTAPPVRGLAPVLEHLKPAVAGVTASRPSASR